MIATPNPATVRRVRAGLALKDRSPLDYFRWSVPRLRDALRLFTAPDPVEELVARGANLTGKTYQLAAFVLACLQKRKDLDGVPIPQWEGPVSASGLVLDYEQQKLSMQPHVLKLLGSWPFKPRWKSGDILASLKIKPLNGSDDPLTWSELVFMSQENRHTGVGARRDIVWADEPAVEPIWREMRKAGHVGRPVVRLHGFTPTKRREWAWIRDEIGDGPRDSIRRISREWAEVRWSLHDNALLDESRIAKLLRQYKKDALYDARVFGDYSNDEGECPFDVETIMRMLDECEDPVPLKCRLADEADEEGRTTTTRIVEVETWGKPRRGYSYLIVIDPSAGIDDSRHDPAGLHALEVGSGDLLARYVGPLPPYLMGRLAAGLARQFNDAMIDVEVNDGWGLTVLKGIYDSHYGNLGSEMRETRPGEWSKEVGYRTNQQSRARMVGAVQAWIESWRAGARYGICKSRKVLECLLDCVLDDAGKPVAAPGLHDEDLILRGQGLLRAVTRSGRVSPEVWQRPASLDDRIAAAIQGHPVDEDEWAPGAGLRQARNRPRV